MGSKLGGQKHMQSAGIWEQKEAFTNDDLNKSPAPACLVD
jgi:hypothetical protein